MQNIDIPEVQSIHQTARFYKEGGVDMIEIGFVGHKDTMIKKVAPEHMARFRDEWNLYCDGAPLKKRDGTPLTEVKGVTEQLAEVLISKNVHTAEELAALSDAQCQGLGHGTLTFRNSAHVLLEQKRLKTMEEATRKIGKAAASVQAMPTEELDAKYATKADLDEIKAMLVQALTPKKPGRPKKEQED